jgi:hypothetical protein
MLLTFAYALHPDQDGNNGIGNMSHRKKEEIVDEETWEDDPQ